VPNFLLIERQNDIETVTGDYYADLGSGIGVGRELTPDGTTWLVVEVRNTDGGAALVIERGSADPMSPPARQRRNR
jgi:hypothetical protein